MSDAAHRVRISDIAARAGVSTGTVDRVIHNRGEVSARTRQKVLDILQEMHYEPDILARLLASKKTYRFVSLIPEPSGESLFWEMPALGLQSAYAQVRHYGIMHDTYHFDYFSRETFKASSAQALDTHPDGVIMAPVFTDLAEAVTDRCVAENIPVVLVNSNLFNLPAVSFVGQDSFRSGTVAASLLDFGLHGQSVIWVINMLSEKGTNQHLLSREEGFTRYFESKESHAWALHTVNIVSSDFNGFARNLAEVWQTAAGTSLPDAIFVTNSRVHWVARYLEEHHIRQTRLIGYDLVGPNIEYLQRGTIQFLISQQPFEQGFRSLMSLFDHVVMKKQVGRYQYLPIDIITKENIEYYLKSPAYVM